MHRLPTVLLLAAAVCRAAPPQTPPTVDDYTVLLLHLDEPGAVADATGTLAAGTAAGDWVEGRFGQAFRPTTSSLDLGHDPAMDLTRELTLEAWVKAAGAAEELQRVAFRSGLYGLYLDAGARGMTFFVSSGGVWRSARAPIEQGRWVHVAGTYDGRRLRLFLDGEPVAEEAGGGPIDVGNAPFLIGGDAGAGQRLLNGAIDEVRLSAVAREDFGRELRFSPTTQARVVTPPDGEGAAMVPEAGIGRAAAAPAIDGRLDEALWTGAVALELRDAPLDRPRTQNTTAWLAWDDSHLYLAARAYENQMDKLVAEVTDADGPVWNDDAIEVFVGPRGDGDYYHFAVNPLGAVYDARRTDAEWDSGARAAAAREDDAWTVELAIPWAALGGPPSPDAVWRGNVARSRAVVPEVASWSPVQGRFHNAGRFGRWTFGDAPVSPRAEATATLTGQVSGPGGQPLVNVPVMSPRGLARTNARGRFTIDELPRGPVTLVIDSPRYEPLAVEVSLARDEEQVLLPALVPVDVNRLATPVDDAGATFAVYAVPPLDEPDPRQLPPDAARGAALTAFAAPGEVEPLGAMVVAHRDLAGVTASVSPLTGPGGATLRGDALDLRLVRRVFMRAHYSRPPEEVGQRSRYLMPMQPFDMPAGTFRNLHLIVHTPADAAPGTYRGTLTVTAAGAEAMAVPIELEVLPLELGAPEGKHHSIYYRANLGSVDESIVRAELADIRAHGADRILWRPRILYSLDGDAVKADFSNVVQHVDLMQEYGFSGPYLVWNGFEQLSRMLDGEEGPRFRAAARETILGLQRLAAERGWPELVLTHMDEVFGRERFDRYVRLADAARQVPDQRIYITFHNRPDPEVEEMTRRIDPYVDIRGYHGHSIDEWLAAGHTVDELAQQLAASGDEGWAYYNPRSIEVTPEWARLTNGYWLWLMPITTHVPWAYNSWQGDPLEDADGYDFGYAFPVDGQIIPTRLWEGYREGVDDLRYLGSLERAVAEAKAAGRNAAAVAAAEAWLAGLRRELLRLPLEPGQSALVKALDARYGEADYDAWRRQAAEHLMRVRG